MTKQIGDGAFQFHPFLTDENILAHWSIGKDTRDIARHFFLPESHIANRLPAILQRCKQDQEWNSTVELRA